MLTLAVEQRLIRLVDALGIHRVLPVPMEDVARRAGWEIIEQPCLAPLFGMIYVEGGQRVIVVNSDLGPEWRRATISHELGHWICGHIREGQRRCSTLDLDEDDELDACAVGSLLLIPRRVLRPDATRHDIARECGVPIETVRRRLMLMN